MGVVAIELDALWLHAAIDHPEKLTSEMSKNKVSHDR